MNKWKRFIQYNNPFYISPNTDYTFSSNLSTIASIPFQFGMKRYFSLLPLTNMFSIIIFVFFSLCFRLAMHVANIRELSPPTFCVLYSSADTLNKYNLFQPTYIYGHFLFQILMFNSMGRHQCLDIEMNKLYLLKLLQYEMLTKQAHIRMSTTTTLLSNSWPERLRDTETLNRYT